MAGTMTARELAAFRDELASLNPDAVVEAELFPALGREAMQGRPVADYEQLQVSLKAQKYQFLEQAEAVAFITKAEKWSPGEWDVAGTATRREQEKAQNKALKLQIANAEADNQRLLEEVAEEYEKSRSLYEQCAQELQGLSTIPGSADGMHQLDGLDLNGVGKDELESMHNQARIDAMAATEDVQRLEAECQALRARRLELDTELQQVESQKTTWARRARKNRLDEAREEHLFKDRMKVLERESQLGLPSLAYDSARGIVVISPPQSGISATVAEAVRNVKEEIRTVAISIDDNGVLVQAEAHPALSVLKEAAEAVKHNDVSRLILAIWLKLLRAAHTDTERRAQAAGS